MNWCNTFWIIIFTSFRRAVFLLFIWWDFSWRKMSALATRTRPYPPASSSPTAALVEFSRTPKALRCRHFPQWAKLGLGSPQSPRWDHILITYSWRTSRRLTQPNTRTHTFWLKGGEQTCLWPRAANAQAALTRRRPTGSLAATLRRRAAVLRCLCDRLLVVVCLSLCGCFKSPVQMLVTLPWVDSVRKNTSCMYIAPRRPSATKCSLF